MIKLIDYKKIYISRGYLIRFRSEYPYEDTVDLMVFEPRDPSTNSEIGLMAITGLKAGLINTYLPKEASKNGALLTQWLKDNWNKWVAPSCLLEDVYICPENSPPSLPEDHKTIVYENVLTFILAPFINMESDTMMMGIEVEYKKKKDCEGFKQWIYDQFCSELKLFDIDYLHSKKLQHALYYHLHCIEVDRLKEYTSEFGIHFNDYDCFIEALQKLYNEISQQIGFPNQECSIYKLDTYTNLYQLFSNPSLLD